jgi:hypothetical protein
MTDYAYSRAAGNMPVTGADLDGNPAVINVPMTIAVTRNINYSSRGGKHFVYSYTPSEDLTLNGRHTYPAGVPVEYGTSLAELRAMLRRKVAGVTITEAWKATA